MYNNEIELKNLREDIPKPCSNEGFWENVPQSEDGYIITSKVEGV